MGEECYSFLIPTVSIAGKKMTVRMSLDQGKSWPKSILLDQKGGAYSSLTMVDDQTIGILYESSGGGYGLSKNQAF
jgi:sialidase-1